MQDTSDYRQGLLQNNRFI